MHKCDIFQPKNYYRVTTDGAKLLSFIEFVQKCIYIVPLL